MNVEDGDPAKFYMTFKVHKDHKHGEAPPPRPIISGAGSIFENVGKFIEHHIKESAISHNTYLQDTPHFLRILENFKKTNKLKPNSILVTLDVKALYTNIIHKDGLKSLRKKLEQQKLEVPAGYLVRLMDILLNHNIFSFNEELYLQKIGAAMGSPPVPSYANIFMASQIDPEIQNQAKPFDTNNIKSVELIKRFLDDYFMIFNGTTKELHKLFHNINQIHPTIKFTMNHTSVQSESSENRCECKTQDSIPFLDTLCTIIDGKIETDLFKKDTDRNQYLLTSSMHPIQCTRNVPYSLALRIVRICSRSTDKEKRFQELKNLLLERGYKTITIDRALEKARQIPRSFALQKVQTKKETDRSVFAITYDPRLPAIPNLQAKHWRAMVAQDSYLAEVFREPPLTAFKRQKNLRDFLIRAKVPKIPRTHQERQLKGMKKCGKMCTACPYVKEGKSIKIGNKEWRIDSRVNCNSYNIIYLLVCKKEHCKEKYYVGQSKRIMKFCLADHRGYIVNHDIKKATGSHFNAPGHSLSDLSMTVIEQVKKNDIFYRKERERYFINKFNTLQAGMNRQI